MLVWICLLLGFDCVLRFVLLGDFVVWYFFDLVWVCDLLSVRLWICRLGVWYFVGYTFSCLLSLWFEYCVALRLFC